MSEKKVTISITRQGQNFLLDSVALSARDLIELANRKTLAEIPCAADIRQRALHVAQEVAMNIEDVRKLPDGKRWPLSELMAWAASCSGMQAQLGLCYAMGEMIEEKDSKL